jgi:hypothetical protein
MKKLTKKKKKEVNMSTGETALRPEYLSRQDRSTPDSIKCIYVVGYCPSTHHDHEYPSLFVTLEADVGTSEFHWYTMAFHSREKAGRYAKKLTEEYNIPDVLIAELKLGDDD